MLLVASGYVYGEKQVDRSAEVDAIRSTLTSVRNVVHIDYNGAPLRDVLCWKELLAQPAPMQFEPVPFNHPLMVLFSSGTTGLPKAIVHGHGGIVIEHLKSLVFHHDLGPGDRFFWFSISGGTDVCSAFVGGSPLHPVVAGEMSCRYLGCAVDAFDEHGAPVVGQPGELVLTQPIPSMPLGLWGDVDGRRLHAAYFERFPGAWCHGDWIVMTERGTCRITGRSDATLNRGGAEPVMAGETTSHADLMSASGVGSLIQATVGSFGG